MELRMVYPDLSETQMPNLSDDFKRFTEMLGVWTRAGEHPDGLVEVRRRMEACDQEGDIEGKYLWARIFVTCCLRHRSELEAAEKVARDMTTDRSFRTPLIQLGLVLALRGKVEEAYGVLQRACTVTDQSEELAAQEFLAESKRSEEK